MSAPTQDLIDRLGAAALDARTAIREAHEVQRDLRVTIKEVQAEREQLKVDVAKAVARVLEEAETADIGAGLRTALDNWTEITSDTAAVVEGIQVLHRRARLAVAEIESRLAQLKVGQP